MDADLEERQRMIDEEYRAEALRVVKGGGYFSDRLHDLLEEQDAVLDEQFRRDNRRAWVALVAAIALAILAAFFPMIVRAMGGKP